MPTVYQADSLWMDIEVPLYSAIDSTWANWSGIYEVSTTESATPSITGNLSKNADGGIFYLRLSTNNSTWTSLAVGTYKLMIQISNSTAGYREERHYKLVIKTQGLT